MLYRLIHIFSFIFLGLSQLTIGQENSEPAENEIIEEALPSWLAGTAFQIKDRLLVQFDGSEEAGNILRSSESWNRLLFMNSENWRVRREYPFTHSTREALRLDGVDYLISSRNRKISAPKKLSNSMWIEVAAAPYKMAKEMGFPIKQDQFSDWLSSAEDMEIDGGGKLKVERNETETAKSIRVLIEGPYSYDAKTKVKVLEEWTLEYDVKTKPEDLEESLVGGSS